MLRKRAALVAGVVLVLSVPAFAGIGRSLPAAPQTPSTVAPSSAIATPFIPQIRPAATSAPRDLPILPSSPDPETPGLQDLGSSTPDPAAPPRVAPIRKVAALDTSDPWIDSPRPDATPRPAPLAPLAVDEADPWNGQPISREASPRLELEQVDPWTADAERSL